MKLSNVCLQITISALAAFALTACPSPGGNDPGDDDNKPDAGVVARCGDGTCQSNETSETCAADCQAPVTCGDHVCAGSETAASCPADCGPAVVCGDNVCASSETTSSCPADCDAKLAVRNNSSYTIYYLYVAQCGAASWGNDQLGSHVISPTQTFTLSNIPPGCWAFKATDSTVTHTWTTSVGVNLTAAETYTWTLIN